MLASLTDRKERTTNDERYPLMKNSTAAAAVILLIIMVACRPGGDRLPLTVDPAAHPWLKGKKIFIDPGHGGQGARDPFRQGPTGITEEAVNLRVSLVLRDLLHHAGAVVSMSRTDDSDVALTERVRMAERFAPDCLVSIHHNGSIRRVDAVNYPLVFFWGTRDVNPASYAFAAHLLKEFERITPTRGHVLSDFSVFAETGSRILRETRDLCPGVIGECGFFTHPQFAVKLNDAQYHLMEAEAYFTALSGYLKRGIPGAEAVFDCPVTTGDYRGTVVTNPRAAMTIRARGGHAEDLVQEGTLTATLDGVPVTATRLCEGAWRIQYGTELHPGNHRLRFRFRNRAGQESMVLQATFGVAVRAGDHGRLVREGTRLAAAPATVHRGILMLQAALSMGLTDPGDDRILHTLAQAYARAGDAPSARYYTQRLTHFYPQSPLARRLRPAPASAGDYRFPVDQYGRAIAVRGSDAPHHVPNALPNR